MIRPVKIRAPAGKSSRARASIVVTLLAVFAVLAGCGSASKATPKAGVVSDVEARSASEPSGCAATVLDTRVQVLERVYGDGVRGERVASAEVLIEQSRKLRAAVEGDDRSAALQAARALLATGHLTDLRVTRDGRPFINVGGPALTPLRGTLKGAGGAAIASYVTSVWSDEGFLAEAGGISQGVVVLRTSRGASVGGSPSLGAGSLPTQGRLKLEGVAYSYTSFAVEAYPSGALRVYLLIPTSATVALCGHTTQDTTVNTLRVIAKLIYKGESGRSARRQVQRVQHDRALLEAVADRDPAATEHAIRALLNEHIVRLRVSAGAQLLSDVGGPYVLAPVSAPLRLGGHTIGSFVLSIQDDEGYLRLTKRLAALDVLMYMNRGTGAAPPQLVKDSLGPLPGPALASVPASGSFDYKGHTFRVFTVHAEAFPSGPLTIRVLVPIPYP